MVGSQKSKNSHKNFKIWKKGNWVGCIIKFLFWLRNSGKGLKGKMGETESHPKPKRSPRCELDWVLISWSELLHRICNKISGKRYRTSGNLTQPAHYSPPLPSIPFKYRKKGKNTEDLKLSVGSEKATPRIVWKKLRNHPQVIRAKRVEGVAPARTVQKEIAQQLCSVWTLKW